MSYRNYNLLEFLNPFESFEQVFSFVILYLETKNKPIDSSFVLNTFKMIYPESKLSNVDVISNLFFNRINEHESKFLSSYNRIKEILNKENNNYLEPYINKCLSCQLPLHYSSKTKDYVVYDFNGGYSKKVSIKTCYICNTEYSLNYYTEKKSKDKKYYSNSIKTEYLILSKQTIFSKKLIQYLDYQIVRNGVSFEGFEDTYNDLNSDKIQICRKRVSEQWFNYKISQLEITNSILNKWSYEETEIFIKNNFNKWINNFMIKWSYLHDNYCKRPYCNKTSNIFNK